MEQGLVLLGSIQPVIEIPVDEQQLELSFAVGVEFLEQSCEVGFNGVNGDGQLFGYLWISEI